MTFPVKYRDLSPTSRIVFTVWAIQPRVAGGAPLLSATGHVASSAASSPPPPLAFLHSMIAGADSIPDMVAVPLGGSCLPLFSKKGYGITSNPSVF